MSQYAGSEASRERESRVEEGENGIFLSSGFSILNWAEDGEVAETQKNWLEMWTSNRIRAQSIHGTFAMRGEAKMAEKKSGSASGCGVGLYRWAALGDALPVSEGEIFAYRLSILEQVKTESRGGQVCLMAAVQGRNDVHF